MLFAEFFHFFDENQIRSQQIFCYFVYSVEVMNIGDIIDSCDECCVY